jgi:antitoxin (DNA-binding transcriptional repressor) of toxin-antitoxin stability system
MRTINRRTLAHETASVLDQVLETGEPVEVVGRDGRAVVIMPRPESLLARWEAQGLVQKASVDLEAFDRLGAVDTDTDWKQVVAEVSGES